MIDEPNPDTGGVATVDTDRGRRRGTAVRHSGR